MAGGNIEIYYNKKPLSILFERGFLSSNMKDHNKLLRLATTHANRFLLYYNRRSMYQVISSFLVMKEVAIAKQQQKKDTHS